MILKLFLARFIQLVNKKTLVIYDNLERGELVKLVKLLNCNKG